MNFLRVMVISLCLVLWPINLYFSNTIPNIVEYITPTVLIVISYFTYKSYPKSWFYLLPILLIGVVQTKLIILPIIFFIFELITQSNKKIIVLLLVSLIVFSFSFKAFKGQTVFNKDYEGEQLILRNIHLYSSVFTARIFQNKPKIYINKVADNFFALTDPNNYFFGLHPRPIPVNNQNLFKYPFVAIIFFLYGLYHIKSSPEKRFILITLASSILSLMVLTNFDRTDFILWVPVSLIIIHGINWTYKNNQKMFSLIATILVIFGIPEVLRSFSTKLP